MPGKELKNFTKKVFSLLIALSLLGFFLGSRAQNVFAQDADTPTPSATEEPPAEIPSETPAPSDTPVPSDTLPLLPTETSTPTLDFSPTAGDTELNTDTPTPTLDLTQSSTPTETETETPTPTETGTVTETPTETPTQTATPDCATLGAEYAELCAQIVEGGSARVLVQLDVSVKPAGQLSDSQENAQEARIDNAQEEVKDDLAGTDSDVIRELETIPYMSVEVNQEGLAQLIASDAVQNVAMDGLRPTSLIQSVPLIGAPTVWNYGYTGAGQTIAILDTGIQKTHPFITAAKVVSEACYSTTDSRYGSSSFCPNGFDSQIGPGAGVNCTTFFNECAHGTHVAGIAAGKGPTFSGVAPDATLISIQVFSRFINQTYCGHQYDCALAWDSDILAGLERVYELQNNGAFSIAAVNLSLGSGLSTAYCDSSGDGPAFRIAIDNLRSVGVATVIAAGNSGFANSISFPACISSAVSVGATTKSDQIASYSNRASFLSLLAPGSSIYSSVPTNSYEYYNGTSMAAPHVAGVFALLKQVNPSFTVTQMLSCLRSSGVSVGGYPRIQVANAFVCLSPRPAVPTLLNPAANGWANTTSPTFEWQGSANSVKYQILFSRFANFSVEYYNGTLNPGETSLTQTLDLGTFYWRVRGINQYELPGDWSPGRSVTIDTAPPAIPAPVSPGDASISRLVPIYKWGAISDAAFYQFQSDDDVAFNSVNYDSGQITATTIQPSFEAFSVYYWRVRARDLAGNWSAWSTVRSIQIIAPLPVAPLQTAPVAAFLTNDNTPDFAWNPVDWSDVYEIQIASLSTFTPVSMLQDVTGASGVVAYTATTIPDGLRYWRVRAFNVNSPAEPGAWSAARAFTVDTIAPLAPAQSKPLDNSVQITTIPKFEWLAALTATQYHLQISDLADFSHIVVEQSTSALTYTLTAAQALDLDISYWRVQAADAAGNWGDWSLTRSVIVTLPLPAAPAQVSPASGFLTNDNTPTLTASGVPYGDNFEFQLATNAAFTLNANIYPSATAAFDTPSLADALWYWRVRMTNSGGAGAWSAARTLTVDTTPPAAPNVTAPANNFLARNVAVNHTWTATAGASLYQIQYDELGGAYSLPTYESGPFAGVAKLVPLQPLGNYIWHMRAGDAAGNWGPWSVERALNIILPLPAAPLITNPPTATVTTNTMPTFTWNASANSSTYELELATNSTFTTGMQFFDAGGNLNYTPLSPLADAFYYWRVHGINANGTPTGPEPGAWSTPRTITVDTTGPLAPAVLAPADNFTARTTAPMHSWTAAATATQYQLQYFQDAVDMDLIPPVYDSGWFAGTTRTPAFNTLGSYDWRLRARDAAGNWGPWTATRSLNIRIPIPAVAPVLTAPAASFLTSNTAPHFTWSTVANGSTYEIQIATNATFTTGLQSATGLTNLFYDATTPADGIYYWRVRAWNANPLPEAGPFSAMRMFTVDITPPAAPGLTLPADNAISVGTPTFTWTNPGGGATQYELLIDVDGQNFSSPAYDSGWISVLSFKPPASFAGISAFDWKVRARDAAGNPGDFSAVRNLTINPPLPGIPSLSLPVAGFLTNDDTPTFTWTAVPYGDHYEIWIDTASNFALPHTQEYNGSAGEQNLSYTATHLADGTYYWWVWAYNATGQHSAAWSSIRSFTVDTTPPLAPTLMLPANLTLAHGTAPLHQWAAVVGASSYQIQYDETGGGTPVYTSPWVSTTSYTPVFNTLGTYDWRVTARDAAGNLSLPSAVRTLSIVIPIPAAPVLTAPVASFLTNINTPHFTWNAVANGNTYEIQIASLSTFTPASMLQDVTGGVGVLSYDARPLATDGLYYWRVRAYNANATPEFGAWSLVRSFTLDTTAPLAPVITAPVDNFEARATAPMHLWTAAATATQYQLQYFQDGVDMDLISPVYDSGWFAGTTRTPVFSTLGYYDWRLRARDAAGNEGAWATVRNLRIKEAIPAAPVLVTPLHNGTTTDNTPTFTWQSVPWGATYEIQLDNTSTFASPEYSATGLTGLSQTSSLVLNGTYYWRVRAVNALSEPGPWSVVRILKII